MHTWIASGLFIYGLILGSFFNVVGLRVPKKELFKEQRSYCPSCKESLQWYELIPVISFVIQSGRCRHCRGNISKLYPVMELFSGIMFSSCYLVFGWSFDLLLALLLMSLFHIIIVSDLSYMVIPDKVLLFFFILLLSYRVLFPLTPFWAPLIGGFAGIAGTALIILASRGGMGGGDMKLFGLIGFALGLKLLIVTFFLATLIGTLISGSLLWSGKMSRKQPIPFGPFIVLGAIIALFSGKLLIEWYLTSFF